MLQVELGAATAHADVVTTSEQLGSVCNEHVDEIEFLEETVPNLAELLANPHLSQQELLDWRCQRLTINSFSC